MTVLPERSGWHVGALIRDEDGVPTWRYRVEPFQQAVARSGMSLAEIERKCGWGTSEGAKSSYLARAIGLRVGAGNNRRSKDGTAKRYPGRIATSLSYENAVKIARALDLDLVEWEL